MDDQLEKRLTELARRSDTRGIPTYTDFLDLSGQSLLNRLRSLLPPVEIRFWGGADGIAEVRDVTLEDVTDL